MLLMEEAEAPASREQSSDGRFEQVIDTPDGQVTISFKPKERGSKPLIGTPSSLLVMAVCRWRRPI